MKQFEEVSCKYGAPMGRYTYGQAKDCKDNSISLFRVKLNGDYDDGGAYWGGYPSKPLYCARCLDPYQSPDDRYRGFTRANSRAEAARELMIPACKLITGKKDGIA
jgi:hypothetical protein